MKLMKYIFLLFMALFLWSCEGKIAGGVTEETNSIAGVLYDSNNKLANGVPVSLRAFNDSSLSYTDTTDREGHFNFEIKEPGFYGVSGKSLEQAFYQIIEYKGISLNIQDTLKSITRFSGHTKLSGDSSYQSIEISLPGTDWKATSDSLGFFIIDSIPMGSHFVYVKSPDLSRYYDSYFWVDFSNPDYLISSGPLSQIEEPPKLLHSENSQELVSIEIPVSVEYGLVSWWPMDVLQENSQTKYIYDARGRADIGVVYGDVYLDKGVKSNALVFNGASDFVVIENDRGSLNNTSSFTMEALVYIEDFNEIDSILSYRKNLIGKLAYGETENKSLFSLAVIKNECGVKQNSLAFFIADGQGKLLDCENAVIAPQSMPLQQWVHTIVVWDGVQINLYLNGDLVATQTTNIQQWEENDEAIYFGKENLNFKLDEVRFSIKAISQSDVLYRYYNHGGIQ